LGWDFIFNCGRSIQWFKQNAPSGPEACSSRQPGGASTGGEHPSPAETRRRAQVVAPYKGRVCAKKCGKGEMGSKGKRAGIHPRQLGGASAGGAHPSPAETRRRAEVVAPYKGRVYAKKCGKGETGSKGKRAGIHPRQLDGASAGGLTPPLHAEWPKIEQKRNRTAKPKG